MLIKKIDFGKLKAAILNTFHLFCAFKGVYAMYVCFLDALYLNRRGLMKYWNGRWSPQGQKKVCLVRLILNSGGTGPQLKLGGCLVSNYPPPPGS